MNLVEILAIYVYHLKTYVLLQINFNPSSLSHGRILVIPKISSVDPDGLPDAAPKLLSIGQVKKILKFLNPCKASGVDNVSPWTIKHYAEELQVVIHNIISASIHFK